MEVIPAIDLMKGEVVRLLKGDPRYAKSYKNLGNPVSFAEKWKREGAKTIHIIDLDAALGLGSNAQVIKDVVKSVNVSVQVGGGIRNINAAQALLDTGVNRIIIGSVAFRQQQVVKTLINQYGDSRVIVALDHLNGSVMVNGWTVQTKVTINEAVSTFSKIGVKLFLVTSVARDGTMTGPDFETLKNPCFHNRGVIAAGGIRNVEDILALKPLGVIGVVVGKALYEGQIDLKKTLNIIND